jgi:two-component system, NarL family, nitrate/nitrite response regulator NarL
MSDNIDIVIVDDHPLFREGVANTLCSERDFHIAGQGDTAEEAIRLASDLRPDIMVLDIDIPGSGLHAAETIAATCPVTKIVVLTVSANEDHLVAAIQAGARAYILKGVAARELVKILRAVAAGEVYVPPALAASLLRELTGTLSLSRHPTSPLDALTGREEQILEGVAAGLSNKAIGQQLYLSEQTVKHYVTSIFQKLHVHNRVEAALLAQKNGRTAHKS